MRILHRIQIDAVASPVGSSGSGTMPANLYVMPRPIRPTPNAGDPDGWPWEERTDPVAETARRLVVNIRQRMGDSSIRATARAANIDHNVLRTVLAGESWPDLITIAKLEQSIGSVWPGVIE